MSKIGFFQMLNDPAISWREREAINDANAAGATAMQQADALGDGLLSLRATVAAQNREIAQLRAALGVLAQVLCDRELVDASMLDYRLEAAMENAVEQAQTAAQAVQCAQCGRQVPAQQTVMTEHGAVCDRCHALGG